MLQEARTLSAALAAVTLVVVSSAYLPVARLLHYAAVDLASPLSRPALLAVPILAAALLYERLVRGALYSALRARLPPGLGAPAVALTGAIFPAAIRVVYLPAGHPPLGVLVGQAFLVEAFIGLGLAFIALGSGATLPGGIALGLVWVFRIAVTPVFHGGAVPLMELVAAILSALAVALVLSRALAPHRSAVLEAP